MTSPIGPPPSPTTEKYNDVYSRGSSFGQDLTESKVRSLLMGGQAISPFSKAFQEVANFVGGIVGGIADAIRGEGAGYTEIAGAVTERLGPINTAITESGKKHQELADKVDDSIEKQDSLVEELSSTTATSTTALEKAEKAVSDLQTLNSTITQKVEAAARTANTALSKADTGIADAKKANDAIAALNTNFNSKVEAQLKVSQTLSGINSKISEATTSANSANSKIDSLNSTFSTKVEDQLKVSQTLQSINASIASTTNTATGALSEAQKAMNILRSPVDIGTSLIPVDPETGSPVWTRQLTRSSETRPGGSSPAWVAPPTLGTVTYPDTPLVPVDPRIKYRISFWAKSGVEDSKIYLMMHCQTGSARTPSGTVMVRSGAVDAQYPPQPSNKNSSGNYVHSTSLRGYPVNDLALGKDWTYYESAIQFHPEVSAVRLHAIFWNHPNGSKASQQISDLEFVPEIPSQAQVDDAQNKAIAANAEAAKFQAWWNFNQEKWNKVQEDLNRINSENWAKQTDLNATLTEAQKFQTWWNDNQSVWNKNQEDLNKLTAEQWAKQSDLNKLQAQTDTAQNTAIAANTSAIKTLSKIDIGGSLVPYATPTDEEVKAGTARYDIPEWAKLNTTLQQQVTLGGATYTAYGTDKATSVTNGSWVKTSPGTMYRMSFWARSSIAGSKLVIYFTGQDNKQAAKNVTQVLEDGTLVPHSTGWLFNGNMVQFGTEWKKYEFLVELRPEVERARLTTFYWNYTGAVGMGEQWLADFRIDPDIPSQAEIDQAQNEAIAANTKAAKVQEDFALEQVRVNRLVQHQLWNHQDVMELLDIRSPKTWGWTRSEWGAVTRPCPYPAPNISSTSYPFVQTPYFQAWRINKWVLIAAKGWWRGTMEVSINWNSGVVDNWVVTPGDTNTSRVFRFEGGSKLIHIRHLTVTVNPKSLRRRATVESDGSTWRITNNADDLVRFVEGSRLRMKGMLAAKAYGQYAVAKPIYYRNENGDAAVLSTPAPGHTTEVLLFGEELDATLNPGSKIQFVELSDPETMYTMPSEMPVDGTAPEVKDSDKM